MEQQSKQEDSGCKTLPALPLCTRAVLQMGHMLSGSLQGLFFALQVFSKMLKDRYRELKDMVQPASSPRAPA